MDWIELTSLLLAPATGVAGWLVGKRKRNNDFLHEMQNSINTLASENNRLLGEIISVKRLNTEALIQNEALEKKMASVEQQNERLQISVNRLTRENEQLRKEVSELNGRLENVKTITRTK